MTLSPDTSSSAILWLVGFTASARLPSGVKATATTSSPTVTVPTTFTSRPWIESTLIDLSTRLATRAKSPSRLMATPDGCRPTSSVAACTGGVILRSMTKTLLSGTCFQEAPSCTQSRELATIASRSSGVIARFVGGPISEFINGRFATIFGAAGSVPMSTIETVSFPGGITWRVFVSSQANFWSLPTIISCAEDGEVAKRIATENRTTDNPARNAFIGFSLVVRTKGGGAATMSAMANQPLTWWVTSLMGLSGRTLIGRNRTAK